MSLTRRLLLAAVAGSGLLAGRARAQAVFRPETLPPEVLMILQAALTLHGAYEGALDGAWGPASRQALARWRKAAGADAGGAGTLAPLLQGWQAAVAAQNWTAVELRAPPVSLLLPLARVTPRKGQPGLTAFADAAGALEALVAQGSSEEVDMLHRSTLALAPDGRQTGGGRGASGWRGSEVRLAEGRLVLIRSLALGGGQEAALSVSAAPPEHARARLIAASFRRGPGMALLPPRGSALDLLTLP